MADNVVLRFLADVFPVFPAIAGIERGCFANKVQANLSNQLIFVAIASELLVQMHVRRFLADLLTKGHEPFAAGSIS